MQKKEEKVGKRHSDADRLATGDILRLFVITILVIIIVIIKKFEFHFHDMLEDEDALCIR
jgi:hypothetical protein